MKVCFFGDCSFYLKHRIKSTLNTACKVLGQPSHKLLINVSFVSKNEISKLNKERRGVDKCTDVLSFPFLNLRAGEKIELSKFPLDIDYSSKYLSLGDILICTDVAKAQAEQFGNTILREFCFLSLHGFLHLLGFDHIEKDDEQLMMDITEKILIRKNINRGTNEL